MFSNRVVKRQDVESTRREIELTRVGERVAQRCDLFRVATILEANVNEGIIVFERLHRADTFRRVLPTLLKSEELVSRAGAILAAIHSETVNDRPFVHGDFTVENILFSEEADEIAIIDWSPPQWLGSSPDPGREHDILMFLMSLFNRPVFYRKRIRSVKRLARAFLDQYSGTQTIDTAVLIAESDRLLSQYLPYYRQAVLWRYLVNYPSIRRFRRFVSQL